MHQRLRCLGSITRTRNCRSVGETFSGYRPKTVGRSRQPKLPPFTNPKVAEGISNLIDNQLKVPGATDLTAKYRDGGRVVEKAGCTFLSPTVIWCEDPEHPLANTEFLFPFVSVVEVPQGEILDRIGPSLVVTAITKEDGFIVDLHRSPDVERLNIGAISTNQISWDQPHEGNLFDFLYQQRALQVSRGQ